MKKITLVVSVCILLCLSFVACGNGEEDTTQPTTDSKQTESAETSETGGEASLEAESKTESESESKSESESESESETEYKLSGMPI